MNEIYQENEDLVHEYTDELTDAEGTWILQQHEWQLMRFYITAKVQKFLSKEDPFYHQWLG